MSNSSTAGTWETSSEANAVGDPRILIVENGGEIHRLLRRRLPAVTLESFASLQGIADAVNRSAYQLMICRMDGPATDQGELQRVFELLSRSAPDTPIVVVAEQEPEPAYSFVKKSLYHYVPYPVDGDRFASLVKVALEKRSSRQRMLASPELQAVNEFEGMIGMSLAMRDVFQRIIDAASADIPVLVTGETGTGKDLVAAAIHNRSQRKSKPYVPVNTGAIAPELIASELFGHERGAYTGALERREGLFEQADGGTIFLDEISTMDERTQVGLLRILETKTFRRVRGDKDIRVDVRVIAATNESLDKAIQEKRFREDLYYRLDVFHIHVPALRDRPGGVTLLSNHYVIKFAELYKKTVKNIAPETYRCLRQYPWPGNVRELKHVIQRAVLMCRGEEITPDLLPERVGIAAPAANGHRRVEPPSQGEPGLLLPPGMTLEAVEKEYIAMTLAASRGNKKQAAIDLGISRRALYNKIQKYSLPLRLPNGS